MKRISYSGGTSITRRVRATALRKMAPNSGERCESAIEPRRLVDGSGKHRRRMVDSTAAGRLVGPGEKLSTLEEGQLAGGVSEPCRAGWLGSTDLGAAVVMAAAAGLFSSSTRGPSEELNVIASNGAILCVVMSCLIRL